MIREPQCIIIVVIFILILYFFYFIQNPRTRDSFSNKFITFLHHDLGGSKITGGGGTKGGYYQNGQRDTKLRLNLVSQKVDFTCKNVLELGGNAGDFLLKLAPIIAFGVGTDFDPPRINEANFNARKEGFNNIIYYVDDLREGNEMEFVNTFPNQQIDIVMMYAVCDRWLPISVCKRIVKNCSKMAKTLIIEVNKNKKKEVPIIPYLSTVYNSVEEITDWDYCPDCKKRRLFVCKNK